MMSRAPLLFALLLLGCPTEEEAPAPTGPTTYEEDDDNGNHRRSFAEEVDDDWDTMLVIEGSMHGCGAEELGNEWDYTEDRDYYEFEVSADGWLEVTLEWSGDSDLDMAVRTNGQNRSMLDDPGEGPVEYAPEDSHEGGDDINVGVFCKTGEETDYTVTVELELD